MAYNSPKRNVDLIYDLKRLGMAATILHIGAHPDDEDIGMVVYMARKLGTRVVYWSATRGEGGQNRIGPYRGTALGVYRAWETLAAREVDGGEALFGPFIDFGFSKNGAEALDKWGHEGVVREIVRAIRYVQPQIVIGRWQNRPEDGHGHHQAVGQATREAFAVAGDPAQFPELRAFGLAAWQPQKLYFSSDGDWQPGEDITLGKWRPELEELGAVMINTGEFDPIAGRSYQEQAWIAYNSHQTQAMGFLPEPGDFYYYYTRERSLVPTPEREHSLFDGLDPALTGLTDYPGQGSPLLRQKLAEIKDKVEAALRLYRPDHLDEAATPLMEGVTQLCDLREILPDLVMEREARQALDYYLERKTLAFERAAAQCLGLILECLTDDARVTPGQHFHLNARLWNPYRLALDEITFHPEAPKGWTVQPLETGDAPPPKQAAYKVIVPETAELSCPYWLRQPGTPYHYTWSGNVSAGLAFDPEPLHLSCMVKLNGYRLTLREPAIRREAFAGGYRELIMAIIPPISLHPKTRRELVQATGETRQLTLPVVARSNTEHTGAEGKLILIAPEGWEVTPTQVELSLGKVGDARTLQFQVTIPGDAVPGEYRLHYQVHVGGRDYAEVLEPIRMGAPGLPRLPDETTCTKEMFVTSPAEVLIQLVDVEFAPNLWYAYIQGAADEVANVLSRFDLRIDLISDEEMGFIDLSQFDAVIIGPNAYLMRDELRKNAARFLEYVAQGGTLIVQYQAYGYQGQGFTPYPFRYNQPHDRVTYEDAPVTLLELDHFLFHQPNPIRLEDWAGWVIERGLYFFGEWDEHYQPLLACNDPGENSKQGGMLVASYGRGTYVYTAYSFFRQLPAGVPGAFRLFANLLALPVAHLLKRAERLRAVPLFVSLDEKQLQTVAQLMVEQRVEDGIYLCHEGDVGDELYVVAEGQVEVVKESAGGQVIYLAEPGKVIGEMEVLSGMARAAALRARGKVQLFVLSGNDFRNLLHSQPALSDQVIHILVAKLAAMGG
jgi:LmbE family N-acetylglucosaminyl deacetylase